MDIEEPAEYWKGQKVVWGPSSYQFRYDAVLHVWDSSSEASASSLSEMCQSSHRMAEKSQHSAKWFAYVIEALYKYNIKITTIIMSAMVNFNVYFLKVHIKNVITFLQLQLLQIITFINTLAVVKFNVYVTVQLKM